MASNLLNSPVQQPFSGVIDYSEIQEIAVVGKGAFGVVWKGLWRNTFVAVKHINSEAEKPEFGIEVRQLSRVDHPNIVRLYGYCTQPEHVCLVMEYAEGGSLYNVLHSHRKPKYTAAHAMSWARQCAEGVAYLHAMKPKPLIHRDLKPPNLLLVGGGQTLKICDFGTAVDKATYMSNNKGSAAWMAPEVFESSSYTEKCDVFSWGIILWEVLSRRKPFDEGGSAYSILWAVHKGQRPNLIEGCPKPIEQLMTQCWDQVPSKRPSMAEVVEIMKALCELFPGADEAIDYSQCEREPAPRRAAPRAAPATQDSLLVRSPIFSETSSPRRLSPIPNYNIGNMNPRHVDVEQYWSRENDRLSPGSSLVTNDSNSLRKEDHNQNYYDRLSAGSSPMTPMKEFNGNAQRPPIQKPLEIEVDPNAWELPDPTLYEQLLGVRNTAGFDKFFQLDTSGSGQGSAAPPPEPDPALDSMHLMLDPHLRPLSPDPTSEDSKRIYEEHKQMAPEYLRVQTELAYKSKQKSELESQMDEEELRQKTEIIELEREKESLIKLYCSLKKQLENERWLLPGDLPHE